MTKNNKAQTAGKESIIERQEALRKESIARYIDLYEKGLISKEDLESVLSE